MGDFIRCVRQSFNEMLHDENYQVGILLAIFFALLFLPIFNVQGHFALKMQIAMVIATIVSLPFLLMFVFALDNCYSLFSLFKLFKRKINMGLGKPRSQAETRTPITRVINAYLFNPYGVRGCYPVYFGDLNLEIKKGFGTYCQAGGSPPLRAGVLHPLGLSLTVQVPLTGAASLLQAPPPATGRRGLIGC